MRTTSSRRPGGAILVLILYLGLSPMAVAGQPSLQDLIDQTPENGILVPPPGVYHGSITLEY